MMDHPNALSTKSCPAPTYLQRMIDQHGGQWLFVLLAISTIVDLFFFTGYYSSDDISYYGFARHAWQFGEFPNANQIGGFRLVIVGWNWLLIALFGPSPAIVSASYVLFHQLLNALVFVLGRRLFGRGVGLIAAYLTATSPVIIVFASMILPDILCGSFFVLSLYAFHRAYDRLSEAAPQNPSTWWMLLCGLATGAAYSAKETGLILLPFYFVLWLVFSRGRSLRTAFWIGASFLGGVVIIFAIEFFALSALLNQWVFRLTWTVEDLDPATRAHIGRYGTNVSDRLQWVFDRLHVFYEFMPRLVGWSLLGVLVVYPLCRGRRWTVFAMLLWLFGYQTFGSMRLKEYLPPSIQARYFIPILPFAHIVLGAVFWRFVEWLNRVPGRPVRLAIQGVALAAVFVFPLLGMRVVNQQSGQWHRAPTMGNVAQAIQFAARQGNAPIVISSFVKYRLDNHLTDYWPEWLIDANSLDRAKLGALLQNGGFYYVQTKYQPTEPSYMLDELMLRISSGVGQKPSVFNWRAGEQPDYYPASQGSLVGIIRLGKIRMVVRDVGWFVPMATRTGDLGIHFGHGIVAREKIAAQDRQSVRLFHVTGDVAPSTSPTNADVETASGPTTAPAAAISNYDLNDPSHWRISVSRVFQKDGSVDIRITSPPESGQPPRLHASFATQLTRYGWLVPAFGANRGLELKGSSLFEIEIESELAGPGKAELRLEAFASAVGKRPLKIDRVNLTNRTVRFKLATDLQSIWLRPAIKLTGKGELTLKSFSIQRVKDTGEAD